MNKVRMSPLLTAVFRFAASPWEGMLEQENRPTDEVMNLLIAQYLTREGIPGWSKGVVTSDMVTTWQAAIQPVQQLVRMYAASNYSSAAEYPLLALPKLSTSLVDDNAVLQLMQEFNTFLVMAGNRIGSVAAQKLIKFYAVSGNYWHALVECVVPLEETFMIKTEEKRAIAFAAAGAQIPGSSKARSWTLRKYSHQLVTFRDALSNHVSVRIGDASLELSARKATVVTDREEEVPTSPDFKRATPELLSFYDSSPERPERILLRIPLKASLPSFASRVAILTLTVSALIAFCFFVFRWAGVGQGGSMTGTDVAVILVPSAIAASLMLVRDTSTLSAEINKEWSVIIGAVLVGLWIATLLAYALTAIAWGNPVGG
ncbi:hypothetical protein ACWGLB_17860 [Streptomyces sp. NPDC055893]